VKVIEKILNGGSWPKIASHRVCMGVSFRENRPGVIKDWLLPGPQIDIKSHPHILGFGEGKIIITSPG